MSAPNLYSQMIAGLLTELATLEAGYAGLVVKAKIFKANDLPAFVRYAIVVSPSTMPWEERRIGVPQIQYTMRAELVLLVKNFHETDSLFGTTAGSLGLFQLIDDVKTRLRISTLGGLIDKGNKSYDEPAGPLGFETGAVSAFDSDEKAFVHRARLLYTARPGAPPLNPFCHERLP